MGEHWAEAILAWREVLGSDRVLNRPDDLQAYGLNVSGWDAAIPAILRPQSTEEVQKIVQVANQYKTPLYPISTGCNWGMGSKVPPHEAAIVDLRDMNTIHEINVSHQYAVIEPGVTQGQLYDEIKRRNLPLVINVTGSGRDTSLLGNALERGVGYFDSRADSLSGLQVVTGTGEILETGFAHYVQSKISHVDRHGVGPSLDGLFAQSNYGIVTRAGFQLMGAAEEMSAMIAGVDHDGVLPELVDRLSDLQRKGVIETVVHIGNKHRTNITMSPLVNRSLEQSGGELDHEARLADTERIIDQEGFSSWGAVTGLHGTRGMTKARKVAIRAALKDITPVKFLDGKKIKRIKWILKRLAFSSICRDKSHILAAVEPLFGFSQGKPTNAALHSVYWPHEKCLYEEPVRPDQTKSGLLYVLPYLPCSGDDVQLAMREIEACFARYQFTPYITFNLIRGRCIEGVINLAYPRENLERQEDARRCVDELTRTFHQMGYIPYRVGIQSYSILHQDDSFWRLAQSLKQVFDPNGILAPGRYVPEAAID